MARAQGTVSQVFDAAGVDVVWEGASTVMVVLVMRRMFALGDFKKARRGELVFSNDQARTIRSSVESRRLLARAQLESPSLHASFDAGFTPVEISPAHAAGH